MASHHHPTASCYCHCCYVTYTPCHHHPPPPPDSHLHHPPYQPNLYSGISHPPNLNQYHDHFQEHYFQEGRQALQPTVSSLLRRIAALESALRRRSSQTSSSRSLRDAAARTIQTHFRAFLLRRSRTLRQLKELASIKSTLGILKSSVSERSHFDYDAIYRKAMNLLLKLDTIQGGDPMIRDGKSSISRELNRFLDCIQGFSLERRVLNLRYRGNDVKSRVSSSERKMGNVKCGDLKRVNVEKLRGLVERIDKLAEELDEEQGEVVEVSNDESSIRKHDVSGNRSGVLMKEHSGIQPKAKKNVSFVENGKVYRVIRRNHEPFLEEYCDDSIDRDDLVDAERELEDDLCREIEEIGVSSKEAEDDDDVEVRSENEGSLASSDGEKNSRIRPKSKGNSERKWHDQDGTDDLIFHAPLPVKMETRGDSVDKRKKIAK
ncbi:BAG family molecular chaperone regulator 8, chloroplastic [Sesamum alatum]|uniref:BAG family molecular chaperone regulator 8, chloroplastic n=1 Tax=Sesamum alatum TaxID=300844 RepID=A0AAE1YA31_9LAMI|nr:BAG family molecular chaperone regulator 8, chloroplastic [Sesamum alatum]